MQPNSALVPLNSKKTSGADSILNPLLQASAEDKNPVKRHKK